MNDILTLIDELIAVARQDDISRDPKSLKKKDGGECFMVHHLVILKEAILNHDNGRSDKRS